MTKLIDFTPSDEHSLVARILLNINQTLDHGLSSHPKHNKRGTIVSQQKGQDKTVVAQHAGVAPISNRATTSRAPSVQRASQQQFSSAANQLSNPHSHMHTEFEVDLLTAKRSKSKQLLFTVIVIATTAFIALALLLANRKFTY